MSDIEERMDRLESLVEQQQETIEQQQERIDAQQETIERQQALLAEQGEADAGDETTAGSEGFRVDRRGAMKAAGLVGLLGAGAGAATAGPTIGEPGNQVETLYAESLDGSLTGGTAVTDLVGGGLAVNNGSLEPALSSDLSLSNGELAVDVEPGDIGAASDGHDNVAHAQDYAVDGTAQPPEDHGNAAHTQNYAIDGNAQPPEDHGNAAHTQTFAVDGTPQPPEDHGNEAHSSEFATSSELASSPGDVGAASDNHGNEAHSETFAVDGDAQPPESHGNEAHSSEFATSSELASSPGDVGAAPDNHGNEAHSETFALASGTITGLSGGNGIAPGSISDGDTLTTDWSDASALDSNGQIADFSAANDLDSNGNVSGGGFSDAGRFLEADGNTVGFQPGPEWGFFQEDAPNEASANGSAVLSGHQNQIQGGRDNVICGGGSSFGSPAQVGNRIDDGWANTIGGGRRNTIIEGSSDIDYAGIFSGRSNEITAGNDGDYDCDYGFIGGGNGNEIEDTEYATVAGGDNNEVKERATYGFVGGGGSNDVEDQSTYGAVVAGEDNEVRDQANWGFIGGGRENDVLGDEDGIVTSDGERIRGCGTVVGGKQNSARSAFGAVLNGQNNEASGAYAAVPNGRASTASGDFTLAFGNNATVEADGTVAFADDSDEPFAPDGRGLHAQMPAYAPEMNRVVTSARRAGTERLDATEALDSITGIDVRAADDGLLIDPEGFNDAFGLGEGEALGSLDVDAALVAAVQALAARVAELEDDEDPART